MSENSFNFEEYKILREAVKNGTIDINRTAQKNEEMKREKILKEHQYSIYFREKDQCWYTHLPDETKKEKRRKVKKKSKKDLEDAIVQFYVQPKIEDTGLNTLRDVYPKWLDYMESRTSATTTIRRYDCDWRKWLDKDPIVDLPLYELDYITLDTWAHKIVKGQNVQGLCMTSKQYYNTATVIKGCLNYAFEKKAIEDNAYLRVRVDKKLFYVPERKFNDDRDQVFKVDEVEELRKLAWKDYIEKRDDAALAVLVVSYTGLRAGEVCALKWSAVNEDMTELIVAGQIVKEEKRDKDGNWMKTTWKDTKRVKSINGQRTVYVPAKLREPLMEHKRYKNPQNENELIFTDKKGNFINNGTTYRRTVKYAKIIETYRKGTHKLRKTYLSTLYDGGIHESTLTKLAGQAIDGKVLHQHYLKDRSDQNEVRRKIDELL